MDLMTHVAELCAPTVRDLCLASFLESDGDSCVRYDLATEPAAGKVRFH
ncbi:hypothetical protein MCC02038_19670 [Bifidobacteriaceae bacterium MCC02038]|nr:hypothetical protein MCC02038_19670 [Bifidobacteriaceae bacterium MCC02038]